ncbi:hypothetical protein MJT46_008043 [Ovis ammon polii x Ovis aries]|nr:hypothetical protein MJT46_008043 [Ovis ammon polii x Ovis aries]
MGWMPGQHWASARKDKEERCIKAGRQSEDPCEFMGSSVAPTVLERMLKEKASFGNPKTSICKSCLSEEGCCRVKGNFVPSPLLLGFEEGEGLEQRIREQEIQKCFGQFWKITVLQKIGCEHQVHCWFGDLLVNCENGEIEYVFETAYSSW